jgi:hypothetical protein
MTELLVVIALLGFIGWLEWTHAKERRYIINCLIAKTPGQARILNAPVAPPAAAPRTPETFWDDEDFEAQVGA